MPALLVKSPNRTPDLFPLERLPRITIGRSARNDICLSDPFASRVHAEVRREAEGYVLRDLQSANGTYYNNHRVEDAVSLTLGGRIRIGETEIEFKLDAGYPSMSATLVPGGGRLLPELTIPVEPGKRTTNGLLETIAEARASTTVVDATGLPHGEERERLLALIGKVGVTLLSSATLDEALRQVAALVFEAVPAERCLIMLRDAADKDLTVRVAEHRTGSTRVDEIRVSRTLIEEVVSQNISMLTSDAQQDPRFIRTTTLEGIHSVLAVPLGVSNRTFGVIYADSPLQEIRFTEDHLKVLTTLASVASVRVENARLAEEHLERERFERELHLAREIQQRFQPSAPPTVPGYELQGISFPCYEIGGDYYDFIECPDNRLVVALGDVSGKGTSAALLMSSLHAAIHAQASACRTINETITAVNSYLAENIPPNRFVTLFYAELDRSSGHLAFVNAGHNPPFVIRHSSGEPEALEASGIPLGIMSDALFTEGSTTLQPGDTLIIYSDGVSETTNPQGLEFGALRLQEVVKRHAASPAAKLRDQIEAELTLFAKGTPAADDITLVIVKRKGEETEDRRQNKAALSSFCLLSSVFY